MSLNWSLDKIADWEKVCFKAAEHDRLPDYKKGDEIMTPQTNALIWMCMSVDLGEISNTTWKEFYARANLLQTIDCVPLDQRITPEDVFRHIGLRTNVSTKKADAWLRRIWAYEGEERRKRAALWYAAL